MADEESARSDELLEQAYKLQDEVEEDRLRLKRLKQAGHLANVDALAGEVVETILPTLADHTAIASQLMSEHQQGIVQLETAVYTDLPRAFELVMKAVGIAEEVQSQVMALVRPEGEGESFLTHIDGELILGVLRESLAQASAEQSPRIQSVIQRVTDLTLGESADSVSDDAAPVHPVAEPPASEPAAPVALEASTE